MAEAQACGLPVVCPSWGGSIDMVKDHVTGMIVPTGHWTYDAAYAVGVADSAHEIIKDMEGYKQRSRQHAISELSVSKMADKYLEAMSA